MARIIICNVCGEENPHKARGMCLTCYKKQHNKQYRADNKESVATQKKLYYGANRETINKRCRDYNKAHVVERAVQNKRYHEANKEDHNTKSKQYYETHKPACAAMMKHYRETHRDECVARDRLYHREHPKEPRTHVMRFGDKAFHPLNKWFGGCRRHHLTYDTGIHIPETLHLSVRHNIKTGEGMEEINARATEWLESGVIHGSDMTQSLGVFV